MSDEIKFTVQYGYAPMRVAPPIRIVMQPPLIPYVGAIMDFITFPLIWYPMWIGGAVLLWKWLA